MPYRHDTFDPNLNNLHHAMEYDAQGKPIVRVEVKGLSFDGNVDMTQVEISNDVGNPIPISANTTTNSAANPLYSEISNDVGNPIPISANTTTNSAANPLYSEISNDVGNPIPISANTSVNSSSNPLHVTSPEPTVSAFEEPLSVTITPIIQAESMYGLDPDVWTTTELNGGSVALSAYTTWQVNSGTTAGGYARLATVKYMTYQPGQGSMYRWTAAFTTTDDASTNPYPTKNSFGIDYIVQNSGPIDREDGYSFGYSGATDTNAHRKIGILHRRNGKAETRALTITTAPTGNQTAIVTLNGIAYSIALTTSTSVNYTANQIAYKLKQITAAHNFWDIEGCNGIVTFTYYSPGAKSGTYSFSSSGTGTLAAGTFSQIIAGATPSDTWTYVDQWDNQDIQFDPSKINVYGIDMRWLGAGRVRFFIEDPATGRMALVHTQKWTSQYLVPHINKPSLRLIYRSGTTDPTVTPSRNVVVTGSSVMGAIQGIINQTSASQGWFNIDSSSRAKDTVWHLLSIQNPFVRNSGVNKSSIIIQNLSISFQGSDPSVIYIVKDAVGTSDVLVFQTIPNTTNAMFAQYSTTVVSENLSLDRIGNIQTVGANGTATFDLSNYNLMLSPGETVSVFFNSSSIVTRSATGMTWKVD